MPKVSYLLNKVLDPVPSDAVCINVAKMIFKNYVQHRYVELYMDTDNLDALSHCLLFAAIYLDLRFKSFEPFVHISNRKACLALAEKTIKKYYKNHCLNSQTNLEPELAQPCSSKKAKKVPCEDEDFTSFMSASQQDDPEKVPAVHQTPVL